MQYTVEHIYAKGVGQTNEDACFIDEAAHRFAVIDGATGLSKLSGEIAARKLKEALGATEKSLRDCLHLANELLQKEMLAAKVDVFALSKSERSTCGFVAIELKGNRLEYMHAGDCMLFIRYMDGQVREVTYDHLAKLDGVSIAQMHEKIKQMLDGGHPESSDVVKEARSQIQSTIVANRNLLNSMEGYGVFDGTEEALAFMDFGNIALQNVEQILLVSDGLQLPSHKVMNPDAWIETANYAFTHGLQALYEKVVELENEDPHLVKYPRLKFSDDKTGILLKMQ